MKYIRTANSINPVCKNDEPLFDKNDLANTIEELCDEFVEVGNFQPFISDVRFEHWDKQTKNLLNKQGTKVYGAIWTSKGLIYAAKMDEKGELKVLWEK